jgi:hypothetical protein
VEFQGSIGSLKRSSRRCAKKEEFTAKGAKEREGTRRNAEERGGGEVSGQRSKVIREEYEEEGEREKY